MQMIRSKLFWSAAIIALSVASVARAQAPVADSEAAMDGEIVVTAQKRVESIKDVPISITAKSGAELEQTRIMNTQDLSFAVPGLAVAETGPGRQIVVIRGLGSERGSSSLTGIYFDEMPVSGAQDGFNQSYIDLRTTDLERVEVLKGPQGTLFGEGAVGGAIRYITKDPDLSGVSGRLAGTFYDTADGGSSQEVVGILNVPLVDDIAGLRIAGTYENKGGWIDRPSTGAKNINDNEVFNIRAKLLLRPTEKLEVKAMAVVHRNDGGGSNIVNIGPRKESNFLQAQWFDGVSWNRNGPTDFTDNYELYNLTAKYDLGVAELLSSTSRADLDSVQAFTQVLGAPTPSLEVYFRDYVQNAKITSQELRLTSAGAGPFAWTIGAFYKEASISREWRSGYDYVGPDGTMLTGITAGSAPTSTSDSLAFYGDASYAISRRLKIGAGLRYFHDKRESFDRAAKAASYQKASFNNTSFRVYSSYEPVDDVHLYVNIGDGARSGGFNSPANIPLGAPPTYKPERVMSYEAGAKTYLLDRALSLDVAFFYTDYTDMQDDSVVISPVDGVTPIQFTTNDQRARLQGVEWNIILRPTRAWTFGFAGDVTDTKITRTSSASPYDIGDPINFVPKYSISAHATYAFDLAADMPGYLRVEYNRKGKSIQTLRRSAIINPPQGIAPPVDFINAVGGFDYRGWDFSIFGRNLTDERGIIRAGVTGQTAQPRPRTFGFSVGRDF
nr:TonB-dependent receptor [Sphingomonas sp. Y57]